jgi:hypothetical protein
VIATINAAPKPLALYIWSRDAGNIGKVMQRTSSGGACVNHCVAHFAHGNLPFGGVNNSGIGNAHGEYGFKAFSHERAVLRSSPIMTINCSSRHRQAQLPDPQSGRHVAPADAVNGDPATGRRTPVVDRGPAGAGPDDFLHRPHLSSALADQGFVREFGLSSVERGWLNSAFFWSYGLVQMPMGWLVDRYGVKWPYAICFTVWCCAAAATGLPARCRR